MRDDHDNKRIGTWCAAYGQTKNQWLQIDLGRVKYVSAVATQGIYFASFLMCNCQVILKRNLPFQCDFCYLYFTFDYSRTRSIF